MKKCSACKIELPLDGENFMLQTKTTSGFSTECKKCLSKRHKKYREANKEKIRIKTNEYRRNNPDWTSRVKKRDYEKNKQARLIVAKIYRENNPDKCKTTKERTAIKNANRRARQKNAVGSYNTADVKRIYGTQNGRCFYCSVKVGGDYHVDHIVPLSRGGTNLPENICIACVGCNLRKGSKLLSEWKLDFALPRINGNP